jgi:hypothetical protein
MVGGKWCHHFRFRSTWLGPKTHHRFRSSWGGGATISFSGPRGGWRHLSVAPPPLSGPGGEVASLPRIRSMWLTDRWRPHFRFRYMSVPEHVERGQGVCPGKGTFVCQVEVRVDYGGDYALAAPTAKTCVIHLLGGQSTPHSQKGSTSPMLVDCHNHNV